MCTGKLCLPQPGQPVVTQHSWDDEAQGEEMSLFDKPPHCHNAAPGPLSDKVTVPRHSSSGHKQPYTQPIKMEVDAGPSEWIIFLALALVNHR